MDEVLLELHVQRALLEAQPQEATVLGIDTFYFMYGSFSKPVSGV